MKILYITLGIISILILVVYLIIIGIKNDMKNEYISVWNSGNYSGYTMEINGLSVNCDQILLIRGTIRDDNGICSGNCTWSLKPFRYVHLSVD